MKRFVDSSFKFFIFLITLILLGTLFIFISAHSRDYFIQNSTGSDALVQESTSPDYALYDFKARQFSETVTPGNVTSLSEKSIIIKGEYAPPVTISIDKDTIFLCKDLNVKVNGKDIDNSKVLLDFTGIDAEYFKRLILKEGVSSSKLFSYFSNNSEKPIPVQASTKQSDGTNIADVVIIYLEDCSLLK